MATAMEGHILVFNPCLLLYAPYIHGDAVILLEELEDRLAIIHLWLGWKQRQCLLVERNRYPLLGLLLKHVNTQAITHRFDMAPAEPSHITKSETCHRCKAECLLHDALWFGCWFHGKEAFKFVDGKELSVSIGDVESLVAVKTTYWVVGDYLFSYSLVEHGIDCLTKEHQREV